MNPPVNKTSLKDAFENLAKIGVLVVDNDRRISNIVREVLDNLGFKAIHLATDGSEALRIMREEKIDMLITDWRMSPMNGINLVKYLRTAENSPNRFIPIIMLTANVARDEVETARDVGITEFVVKPFSAKTLTNRIVLLIENPRGFIIGRTFVGPDRRRQDRTPPDGTEKRTK